jgi:hypothetical protein
LQALPPLAKPLLVTLSLSNSPLSVILLSLTLSLSLSQVRPVDAPAEEVYAMKILKKSEVEKRKQVSTYLLRYNSM